MLVNAAPRLCQGAQDPVMLTVRGLVQRAIHWDNLSNQENFCY